jgi:F-type H+-transporting ATPase subunit delta
VTEARVARRYARSLFNAASRQGIVPSVEADLNLIGAVSRASGPFSRFLESPDATSEAKTALLEKAFSDRVTALTMAFLRLLVDKGRETILPHVREVFVELRRQQEEVVRAVVTTVAPLDQDSRARVVSRLEAKSGKRVEAEFETDPSLIGGINVRWGDYVLDGSLSGSLARMKERILFDALKQN